MSEWKDRLIYPPLYVIFLLVAIFVVYKAFIIGFEHGEYAGKYDPHVEGGPPPVEEDTFDLALMLEPTDELLTQGEELYSLNCASCHGQNGDGQGPKGAGLNPPPRNFATVEQYKQGGGTLQIYQTLMKGVPGSSMAAFSFLNPQELMALSHYVRTFMAAPPADPQTLVQELAPASQGVPAAPAAVAGDTTAGADTSAAAVDTVQAERVSLPTEFVMKRVLSEMPPQGRSLQALPEVYALRCASCHGPAGEGALVQHNFPNVGVISADTKPLSLASPAVLSDMDSFLKFLSAGMPGQPGHKFPDLQSNDLRMIYEALKQASTE